MIQLKNVSKAYREGQQSHPILTQVSVDLPVGFTILLGKSGSGKSTLLNLISGIDQSDTGAIWIGDTCISHLAEPALTLFRRQHIGIIFQFFNLIPTLTVLENVMLPRQLSGLDSHPQMLARQLLQRVGLADREDSMPDNLSGGEQQRVAIARALINEPEVLVADEPTGNLDEATGQSILTLLLEVIQGTGKTLVMATHNPEMVKLADQVYTVQQQRLVKSSP